MVDIEYLSATIRKLYGIVDELEDACGEHGRHFTLDGHLLGSIGEVYAAEVYGIELYGSSKKGVDGLTKVGRKVQIKVTQERAKNKVVGISHEPQCLLVLQVDDHGQFHEVYDGPGDEVWKQFAGKKRPPSGQYQMTLSKLRKMNEGVAEEERV